MIGMKIFLQVRIFKVSMNISKVPMKMMEKLPQVEILKAVDTFSREGNLKTTMLVIMNFLLVMILNVLMKIFLQVRISKAQMRMKNNYPQVEILKVMMKIMAMLDNLYRMRNLKEAMLVLMIFLQVRIFKVPMKITNIFLQVSILNPVMRMMKNVSQVAIFKVVKMIKPLLVTLSRVIN
jgi:hypothetical protein